MQEGLNLGKRALFAAAVAAVLMAAPARAQTPIPMFPPLPPLPAASESSPPAAAAPQPQATPSLAPAAAATESPAAPLPTPASLPAERPAPEAPGGLPSSVLILLGIGVLVLVATLVVVLTVLLKKPVVINVPSRSAAPPPIPEGPAPAGWTDGGVVHAGQPPAGVLDVL